MKKKAFKISIVAIIALICSCGLFCFANNNKEMLAYAAVSQECRTLIGADRNSTYLSNQVVGEVEGVGEYVVGEHNVVLTAKSKSNFQIVGFKVTYTEQSNKIQYIWLEDLTFSSGSAVAELTYLDSSLASNVQITKINGLPTGLSKYLTEVSLSLDVVFENLSITPVFDHIYAEIDITNIFDVATLSSKSFSWNGKTIYYEQETINAFAKKYSNAYLKDGENYYFYGSIFTTDDVSYYTEHKQLTSSQETENIDISVGAYRYDEYAEMSFGVENYFDIQSFDIRPYEAYSPVELNNYTDGATEYFKLTQHETLLYTTGFELRIQPRNWSNLYPVTTKVFVDYDNLYVATIEFEIDGVVGVNKTEDFFGTIEVDEVNKKTKSNINVNHYFSILKDLDKGAQYLIKKADDNGGKAFGIDCVKTISKKIDATYSYYTFKSLDGEANISKAYANPSQNIDIKISYESIKYKMTFELLEKIDAVTLATMTGESLDELSFVRGTTHDLLESDAKNNIGYAFVGFTTAEDITPQKNLSVTISEEKPKDTVVYLVYEKIAYNIILSNINTDNIDGIYPISSAVIDVAGSKETFENSDNTKTQHEFVVKIKLNQKFSIQTTLNTGFNISYSLSNPKGEEITELEITQEFISLNNLEDNLIIYAFEEIIKYSVSYVSIQRNDPEIGGSVIMSDISVDVPTGAIVTKYDIDGVEIEEGSATIVAKIVITGLKYKDNVVFISSGRTVDSVASPYTYVFSSFTEKGSQIGLSYNRNGSEYSHTHIIENKNLDIEVRYDMPRTKLVIIYNTINNDLTNDEPLTFDYEFSKELNKVENTENEYEISIGDSITITVKDISFGYVLKAYDILEDAEDAKILSNLSFGITTMSGINTVELLFERVEYQFEIAKFSSSNELISTENKTITIKDRKIETEKTLGTYVGVVAFALKTDVEDYNYDSLNLSLKETNLEGKHNPTEIYSKALTVDEFIDLINECGKGVNPIVVKTKLIILPYVYNVTVQYDLLIKNGQNIDLPAIALYSIIEDGEDKFINELDPHFLQSITFESVAYGTNAKLTLTESLLTGLNYNRWEKNGSTCANANYNNVEIGEVKSDITMVYYIDYLRYTLELVFDSQDGSPEALVNGVSQTGSSFAVSLFDKLVINSNANRISAGKKFHKFSQAVLGELEYIHNINKMDKWYANFANLYYYNENGDKIVNTSAEYDETKTYYYDGVCNLVVQGNETSLVDEVLLIENYITYERTISIYISYVDINFNLNHKIEIEGGKLQNGGNGSYPQYQIHFVEEQIYSFVKYENGNFLPTTSPTNLVFGEQQIVYFKINDNAINGENQDGDAYDLSMGVELKNVKIKNYNLKWSTSDPKNFELSKVDGFDGIYKIIFVVTSANSGEIIDTASDDIEITYTLNVQKKKISITTQLTDTSFYKNGIMIFRPDLCGWGADSLPSKTGSSIHEKEFQFLSSTVARMSWTEASGYLNNFEVSMVEIFIDGNKIGKAVLLNGEVSGRDNFKQYGIDIDVNNDYGLIVTAQMLHNVDIKFYIKPKITLIGAPFEKEFLCDAEGNGIAQTIDENIQLSDWFKANIDLNITYTKDGQVTSPINEGIYNITFSFTGKTTEYSWVREMSIEDNITMTILKKKIWLAYEKPAGFSAIEKQYNRQSSFNFISITQYLRFSDKNTFIVNYNSITGLSIVIANENVNSITTNGTKTGNASDTPYDLLLENFSLSGSKSGNFELQNDNLTLDSFIKINRINLTLSNIEIKSKVYDGSTVAYIKNPSQLILSGMLSGDNLTINSENLLVAFLNADEGYAKRVTIKGIGSAVEGDAKDNYNVQDNMEIKSTATIYPYSMTTNVRGVGNITITNRRGLTDENYVSLIKPNSRFTVDVIYSGSNEYRDIFKLMSHRFTKNNEFSVAYSITVYENEKPVELNKDLYITVPNINKLTGAFFLAGTKEGELNYEVERDGITIDLKDANLNVDKLVFTQQKVLLRVWQIVLIVILFSLVITAIVLTFVLIRKRKMKDYSVHEKI